MLVKFIKSLNIEIHFLREHKLNVSHLSRVADMAGGPWAASSLL